MPVAVTAYSGEQLNRQGALDITDIADTTPNVTLEVSRGTNSTLTPFIRGIGQQDPVAGFEQGVGLYLDDVYLNRPQAAVLNIYDVERIEVLRGPQGTLYGRNTIGGAIKYVTRRIPTDGPHMSIRGNLGTYHQADLIVVRCRRRSTGGFAGRRRCRPAQQQRVRQEPHHRPAQLQQGRIRRPAERSSSPPSDSIFFRLSRRQDLGQQQSARRSPSDPEPVHDAAGAAAWRAASRCSATSSILRAGSTTRRRRFARGASRCAVRSALNDWLKFRTITAYRKDISDTPIDFDALPAVDVDVPAIYRNHQFSQELQLVADKGPLQGVAGFYYLDADAFDVFDVRLYTTARLSFTLPGTDAATSRPRPGPASRDFT